MSFIISLTNEDMIGGKEKQTYVEDYARRWNFIILVLFFLILLGWFVPFTSYFCHLSCTCSVFSIIGWWSLIKISKSVCNKNILFIHLYIVIFLANCHKCQRFGEVSLWQNNFILSINSLNINICSSEISVSSHLIFIQRGGI